MCTLKLQELISENTSHNTHITAVEMDLSNDWASPMYALQT